MKYLILFFVLSATSICGFSQLASQVQAKRGVFTEKIYLKDKWINGISTDLTVDSSNDLSLATAKAIADYIRSKTMNINSEWVSVTDFGAKANDTLNDYTFNIQSALNSGARTVLVPTGYYIITDTLYIHSNQTLLAYGAKWIRKANISAVLLNAADGTMGGYNANTNIKILGLTVEGNAQNYPTPNCTLIAFGHSNNITIRDCDLANTSGNWHLLELNSTKNAIVDNVYFHDIAIVGGFEMMQIDLMSGSAAFPWFGPYDSTACDNINVVNCTFRNSGSGGFGSHTVIDAKPHRNILLRNCRFQNIAGITIANNNYNNFTIDGNIIDSCGVGIYSSLDHNNTLGLDKNLKITGNTITRVKATHAIFLEYQRNIIIENNIIDSVNRHAILVTFGDSVTIRNNTISNFGITSLGPSGARYGIACVGTISTIRILNNNIISTLSSNPIVLRDSTTGRPKNVIIEGNVIKRPNLLGNYYQFNDRAPLQCSNCYIGINFINDTLIPNTISISSNYTLAGTEGIVRANTSSGAINVSMNPAIIIERGITFSKQGTNTLTLTPSFGTIDGQSSIIVDSSITVKSDGINYYTSGAIKKAYSNSATLDFPSTSSGTSSDLTISLPGAVIGDPVNLGTPATLDANVNYIAFVSAADTVTVRCNNYSGSPVDPVSGIFKVSLIK